MKGWLNIHRYGLHNVHRTCYIGGKLSGLYYFKTGAHASIGSECNIYCMVEIGNCIMFDNNVSILGRKHSYNLFGIPMIFSRRAA